jgi:hypothetical protein
MKEAIAVARYREHRVALLRVIHTFADELASLDRLRDEAARFRATIIAVAGKARSRQRSVPPDELVVRRVDEHLAYLLSADAAALAFQRRWRVVLVPETPRTSSPTIEVLDDYFVEPVASLASRHHALQRLDPARFLVVDRAAGQKPVFRSLSGLVDLPKNGQASRRPSDPPFSLADAGGHDFRREDLAIARVCMNGSPPEDFAPIIVAEVYPDLAKQCGYVPGRRLPRHAPQARRWESFLRVVRRRHKALVPMLSPLPATT